MVKNKRIISIFLVLLVIALILLLSFYFYQQDQQKPEPIPPIITQESINKELREFKPDPAKIKDPKVVEQELKSFQVNEETKLSEEEILESLNDPNIVPLPKSMP